MFQTLLNIKLDQYKQFLCQSKPSQTSQDVFNRASDKSKIIHILKLVNWHYYIYISWRKNCKFVLKNEYISDHSDDDEEEGKAILNCYQILRYFSVDQNHPRRPQTSPIELQTNPRFWQFWNDDYDSYL